MRRLVFWLCYMIVGSFLGSGSPVLAQSSYNAGDVIHLDALWYRSIELYDQGDYQEAAELLHKICRADHCSGQVLFNLGNTYYRNGQKGAAQGAYLAAKHLAPRLPELDVNIRMIEQTAVDKLPAVLESQQLPTGGRWLAWFQSQELLWLFCLFLAAMFLSLSIRLCGSPSLKLLWSSLGGFCAIGALIFGCAWGWKNQAEPYWSAVVAAKVMVKSAPNEGAVTVFELHEAAPVQLLEIKDAWVKIALSTGKRGWLLKESVLVIEGVHGEG